MLFEQPEPLDRDDRIGGCGRGRRAFTLLEVLIVIAILAVLMALLLPALAEVRRAQRRVACTSNLRQLAVGLRMYAQDNRRFPDPSATASPWESVIMGHLESEAVLRCPADSELFPGVGSSYDWRDTGDPASSLAGRPLEEVGRSDLVILFDAMPDWHQKGKINAAFMDGSVHTMDEQAFYMDLFRPVKDK